jgi:hypothetical protein
MRAIAYGQHPVQRGLIALVLLNGLFGALVWMGVLQCYPTQRHATVRVAPGQTLDLLVALIDTRMPDEVERQGAYRYRKPATVLLLGVWYARTATRSVTQLVAWRLSLRGLALLPVAAALIVLGGSTFAARRRGRVEYTIRLPQR